MTDPVPFGFEVETRPTRTVIRLCGDLDMAAATQCRESLLAAQRDATDLVIDLRGLTFLDSMGLGALLTAHHFCQEKECSVSFIQGNKTVHRVFQITKMDERVAWAEPPESV